MKQLLLPLLVILMAATTSTAETQPTIIFTQNVIATDADGRMLPSVRIDPDALAGMQRHQFDLGRNRLLRIETNINNPYQRGLNDLVATVRRCYNYVEAATGRQLERGVLLYLVELDDIPYAYSFNSSYNDASQWGEVRLALVERGTSLSGREASSGLADLLYDTLPHELGHDVLVGIPHLAHDIDGKASQHTRWFIEGVCEVLAKGFSRSEVPGLHMRYLALRNIDKVLAEPQMLPTMLNWAQNNENGMVRESDLYGAAMLTMMAWTELVELTDLLEELAVCSRPVRGAGLVALLQKTTGFVPQQLAERASVHGHRLSEKIVLAQLD